MSMRFIIERAKDFDDHGNMINGRGWFLNFEKDNCVHSGPWFETYDLALARYHQENDAMRKANPVVKESLTTHKESPPNHQSKSRNLIIIRNDDSTNFGIATDDLTEFFAGFDINGDASFSEDIGDCATWDSPLDAEAQKSLLEVFPYFRVAKWEGPIRRY